VGTRKGADKVIVSKNPFNNFVRDRDSLKLNRGAILSLCEDHRGILWSGLWGGGVNGFERTQGGYRRVMNLVPGAGSRFSIPDNDVNSIEEDHSGNLWLGTRKGLAMLDSSRTHMIVDTHHDGDSSSLVENSVAKIFEDREQRIWICTDSGLSRLNYSPGGRNGSVHRFTNYLYDRSDRHPFGGNVVSSVFEDRSGRLWMTTYGRGLNRLEPDNTFTRILCPDDSAGNKQNFIYMIAESPDGLFWLSTWTGLVVFDPQHNTFTRHPIRELDDAHIFDILPDSIGNLWLSTSIGLARFNPSTGSCTRFGSEDGLQFSEFFSGFELSRRSTLLVGGIDGFAEFSLADLTTSKQAPEIAITSLNVLGKEYFRIASSSEALTLSHDENFLSFSLAVLDYISPRQNRFAYKLSDVDKDWVDAGTRNYATYTNLDPGTYAFQVKGCNSENVWNETGASFAITITPPYWKTWWFRTLLLALFGSLAYTAYRYRLRKLLEMERLRLRIADDLHDDVGSNLSAIAMASRAMHRSPELSAATKDTLAEIYDTAVATSEGMKDIVWFIKPRGDTLAELLIRMRETAQSVLSDMDLTFDAQTPDETAKVSIEFKRNCFLAFKEILTNIVKHAGASKVEIRISQTDSTFAMAVTDNGKGFNGQAVRSGNGLGSLQNRAAHLGGTCEIASAPGTGTSVVFRAQL
jgi:signal transduction histidine kinase